MRKKWISPADADGSAMQRGERERLTPEIKLSKRIIRWGNAPLIPRWAERAASPWKDSVCCYPAVRTLIQAFKWSCLWKCKYRISKNNHASSETPPTSAGYESVTSRLMSFCCKKDVSDTNSSSEWQMKRHMVRCFRKKKVVQHLDQSYPDFKSSTLLETEADKTQHLLCKFVNLFKPLRGFTSINTHLTLG